MVIEGNTTHLKCHLFGDILEEVKKRQDGAKYSKKHANFYDKLDITGLDNNEHFYLILPSNNVIEFGKVSQKIIYENILAIKTKKIHHHVQKWHDRLGQQLDWKKIWHTVHNKTSFESNKTAV